MKMWKLKIAEGGNPWLGTVNDHVGRQIWEFDPKLGSPEELAEIEKVRDSFRNNRFKKKHSSDLLNSVAGSSKQSVVGSGKVNKRPSSFLKSALLGDIPTRSGGVDTAPRKSVSKDVEATPSNPPRVRPSDVGHSADKRVENAVGSSSKRAATFDDRGPNPKRVKVVSSEMASHGMTLTIKEDERWFGAGPRPTHILHDGFKILHDADRYVTKSREDLKREADVYLGRFISSYVRLHESSDDDSEALKKKCEELEEMATARANQWTEEKESLNKRIVELEGERSKLKNSLSSQKSKWNAKFEKIKKELEAKEFELGEASKVTAENTSLKAGLEMCKGDFLRLSNQNKQAVEEAKLSFKLGYEICYDKFVDGGCDGAGRSFEDYRVELAAEEGDDRVDDGADLLVEEDNNQDNRVDDADAAISERRQQ